MRFGVNSSLNNESKEVGIKHYMGYSKVKLPHTTKKPESKPPTATSSVSQHENNLLALTVVAGGLAWYLFPKS